MSSPGSSAHLFDQWQTGVLLTTSTLPRGGLTTKRHPADPSCELGALAVVDLVESF